MPNGGDFSARLKALLAQRGWSAADAARETGLSAATIARYLRGGKPSADSLLRLARTFDVDPWTLYGAPSAQLTALAEEWSDDDPPRWSYSKLADYLRCPAYFYFRHVAEVEGQVDADTVIGGAVHAGIEQVLRAKAGLPAEDPAEAVAGKVMTEAPYLAPNDDGTPVDPDALTKEATKLVQVYAEQVAPTFEPVAVEQRLEADIAGVKVTAVLDVVDSEGRVRDTKTSKRKPAQTDLDESLQATIYDIAFTQHFGQPPKGVVFDYLLRRQNGSVDVATFPARERTDADRNRLARTLEGVVNAVEKGVFYPNPQNKFGCARCPFRAECYEHYGTPLTASA